MPRPHKMLDTMELPPVHRRIFRVILRAQLISYEELCGEVGELPDGRTVTPEMIHSALAEMVESGLIRAVDSNNGIEYGVNLGQDTDSTPSPPARRETRNSSSIWDQLDNSS
ncbi:MAG: hypothetical protein IAE89_10220 [Anaerolineae bacterium]|nr:hypothetical protein [Anaerolineae bacterium]